MKNIEQKERWSKWYTENVCMFLYFKKY